MHYCYFSSSCNNVLLKLKISTSIRFGLHFTVSSILQRWAGDVFILLLFFKMLVNDWNTEEVHRSWIREEKQHNCNNRIRTQAN